MQKIRQRIKAKRLFVLFLSLELLVVSLGWKAFYASPEELSVTDGVPSEYYAPILPPEDWRVQRQWFTAQGEYFNRIIFYTAEHAGKNGGITVQVCDEGGVPIAARHYTPEECSAGAISFSIQKLVKPGDRYCFEVIADSEGAGWSVPYLYIPVETPIAWEDATVDGEPMAGGACHLFLSFFYARMRFAAAALHAAALVAGALYLFFAGRRREGVGKACGADVAALCAACVCAAGQFFLCKNYHTVKTLLLCLPCVLWAGTALFTLMQKTGLTQKIILRQKDWIDGKPLHSPRFWKKVVFLAVALSALILLSAGIRGKGPASSGTEFYIFAAAFLIFLLLGLFSVPRLDAACARIPWLVYAAESILIFVQMEIADANPFEDLKFGFAAFNILTVFAFLAVLWGLLGNFRAAGLVGAVLFAVWGVANYLTVDFRGVPIAPSDLMSAGTALNVLGNYQIQSDMRLASLFVLVALEILLLFRIPAKAAAPAKVGRRWAQRGAASLCAAFFFWQGYFGSLCPVHMGSWEWRWQLGYYSQGYVAVSIKKIQQLFLSPPAGYSSAEVQALYEAQIRQADAAPPASKPYPNIILILNESWFDWRQLTEFEIDPPVTPFLDNLENCIRGFAVGPQDFAGTSLSEYELLTSNSLSMLPGVTPFTQRSLKESSSIVSYLQDLGYTTAAMHPAPSENYNRKVAYPQLGFERISFSNEDANWWGTDCLRGFISDESAFSMTKTFLDEKEAGAPALVYLLTIQNHGGYDSTEQNGGNYPFQEEWISIQTGFDACRGPAEEYLSLVHATDAAFEKLLCKLENEPEPTLVCMVGDHGPMLGAEVESPYEGYEWSMRRRGTPFVIWANYPIEAYDAGYIGMVQLAPLLMQTAGLPLSPWYQAILEVSEEYPVLSAAFYQDASGNFGSYSYTEELLQSERLKRYFYYEYNSLLSPKNRMEELFLAG